MTVTALNEDILDHLRFTFGKDPLHATVFDWRMALSRAVRDRIVDVWFASTRAAYEGQEKRVYYLSMEYLIGRLLEDAVINLGLLDETREAFRALGVDPRAAFDDEPDAALGNGGLGRLAACFMDSLATVGCPATGYGIRYEHGLFRQSFRDGRQIEDPEDWLRKPNPWEFTRTEAAFEVGFGGEVRNEGARVIWHPAEAVRAEAHDTPVIGWQGRWANTLRLWAAEPVRVFDLDRFNQGQFAAAAEPEALARTISRVLYPDDTTPEGKALRLKQEYFFTAASLRDILRRFLSEYDDLRLLPRKAAIQLNDTHPAIAGPELVRLLVDDHGVAFEEAIESARSCLSYTNHTLLPEALERWSEDLMRGLLPRHMQIIEGIDAAHARQYPSRTASILGDGGVKMGELSFVMAHKVNGVSALHTELMASTVFGGLAALHPERIVNQTNGVTPRRWLKVCNPRLSALITDAIGPAWIGDAERLSEIEPHLDDPSFIERFAAIKRDNKATLAEHLRETMAIDLDPTAMFDIQIKRIHEYKRQHLNVLETIALWQEMRDDPGRDWTPRVKIFGGKAAPGYVFAKEIIHLVNVVAARINADPVTRPWLRVVYPPNYNVSLAERLIPAADLSEQVSTSGKEASGTGNMKLAMNGALTVGTLDGANVEIRERVGEQNFFLFGLTAAEVVERRREEGHAARAVAGDPRLARALGALRDGTFTPEEPGLFAGIADNVAGHDYFMVASDFGDYWRVQREIDGVYRDGARWTRMAATNTARSGWFSSDRTIRGYMAEVWDAPAVAPARRIAAE